MPVLSGLFGLSIAVGVCAGAGADRSVGLDAAQKRLFAKKLRVDNDLTPRRNTEFVGHTAIDIDFCVLITGFNNRGSTAVVPTMVLIRVPFRDNVSVAVLYLLRNHHHFESVHTTITSDRSHIFCFCISIPCTHQCVWIPRNQAAID